MKVWFTKVLTNVRNCYRYWFWLVPVCGCNALVMNHIKKMNRRGKNTRINVGYTCICQRWRDVFTTKDVIIIIIVWYWIHLTEFLCMICSDITYTIKQWTKLCFHRILHMINKVMRTNHSCVFIICFRSCYLFLTSLFSKLHLLQFISIFMLYSWWCSVASPKEARCSFILSCIWST